MSVAGAPSNMMAAEFEAESTFGAIAAFSSPTRILPISRIDTSGLSQDKIRKEGVYQRPNDGELDILGAIGGSFVVEMYLTGHGGTAVGSLTATDIYTLLSGAIGGGLASNVGDAAAGGSSATSVVTTSGDFAPSSLCRVGALGDGRAEGQFAGVTSEAANTLTLATALPGAPNSGDDVAAALMVYPSSDPCEAVNSLRWRLYGVNGQYECFGCFATNVSLSGLNAGEVPKVSITYEVAHWRPAASPITFPSTNSTDSKEAMVVAGGSCFLANYGTSTRTTYNLRSISVDIDLQVNVKEGFGGEHPQQKVLGAFIAGNRMRVSMTFDKPVSGTETFDDLWLDTDQFYHALVTFSTTDGKALGLWLQKCKATGDRPTQEDLDGRNAVTLELESVLTGDSGASAPARADWILGLA